MFKKIVENIQYYLNQARQAINKASQLASNIGFSVFKITSFLIGSAVQLAGAPLAISFFQSMAFQAQDSLFLDSLMGMFEWFVLKTVGNTPPVAPWLPLVLGSMMIYQLAKDLGARYKGLSDPNHLGLIRGVFSLGVPLALSMFSIGTNIHLATGLSLSVCLSVVVSALYAAPEIVKNGVESYIWLSELWFPVAKNPNPNPNPNFNSNSTDPVPVAPVVKSHPAPAPALSAPVLTPEEISKNKEAREAREQLLVATQARLQRQGNKRNPPAAQPVLFSHQGHPAPASKPVSKTLRLGV